MKCVAVLLLLFGCCQAFASDDICGNQLLTLDDPQVRSNPFLRAATDKEFPEFSKIADDKKQTAEFGDTALAYLVFTGYPQLVEKLLSAGVQPDIKNDNGATPAFGAAACGNIATLEVLAKFGADLNIVSNGNQGLLTQAILSKDQRTAAYLLAKGVCPRSEGRQVSDLDAARRSGLARVVDFIEFSYASPRKSCDQ